MHHAEVVESVDTRDLKSLARMSVRVQFPPSAPKNRPVLKGRFLNSIYCLIVPENWIDFASQEINDLILAVLSRLNVIGLKTFCIGVF